MKLLPFILLFLVSACISNLGKDTKQWSEPIFEMIEPEKEVRLIPVPQNVKVGEREVDGD